MKTNELRIENTLPVWEGVTVLTVGDSVIAYEENDYQKEHSIYEFVDGMLVHQLDFVLRDGDKELTPYHEYDFVYDAGNLVYAKYTNYHAQTCVNEEYYEYDDKDRLVRISNEYDQTLYSCEYDMFERIHCITKDDGEYVQIRKYYGITDKVKKVKTRYRENGNWVVSKWLPDGRIKYACNDEREAFFKYKRLSKGRYEQTTTEKYFDGTEEVTVKVIDL